MSQNLTNTLKTSRQCTPGVQGLVDFSRLRISLLLISFLWSADGHSFAPRMPRAPARPDGKRFQALSAETRASALCGGSLTLGCFSLGGRLRGNRAGGGFWSLNAQVAVDRGNRDAEV
jgi:hypothetical protein